MNSKKHLIILILKLLETESDKDYPLTQVNIAKKISEVYPCDRKTVGRNIGFLTKIGYPIVKAKNGFYMDSKKFTLEEMRFILRAVRTSTFKNEYEKEDIAERLFDMLCKIYR